MQFESAKRTLRAAAYGAALALAITLTPTAFAAADDGWSDDALTGGARAFRPLSAEEAERKRDLFTDDAFDGMLALARYADYVEAKRGAEAAPGCDACARNRAKLERAYQTVANEAYVPRERGGFSQARWAEALLVTLRGAGGVLRVRTIACDRPVALA